MRENFRRKNADGCFPERILWSELFFNRMFVVGNFKLSTNAFFVYIVYNTGHSQFNMVPNYK